MDFTFSEQQNAMRDSVERMFADLCSDEDIKRLTESAKPVHQELWSQLAEAGIFGLPFAEQYGGLGLGLVELCLIIELQGKSVAPLPLLSSVVESAMTVADSDNASLKQRVLPAVVNGELVVSPVRAYTGLQERQPLSASQSAEAIVLNGQSGFVPYAPQADGFVVDVKASDGDALLVYVDAEADGLQVVSQTAISGEPAGYVKFSATAVAPANLLASGSQAVELVEAQRQRSWIALAALQVGALQEGLQRTAAYVSERKQFGRPLGSFQAVSQQAANAYMEIEALRSVYWRALEDIEAGNDLAVPAAVTKYWVAVAGHNAAHTILHLHGGIGQDLDYPIHRFFLWAKQCERYLGSSAKMSALVGDRLVNSTQQELEQLCL